VSETNGGNDPNFSERLARLEASHVKLMTDHEVAWARHEKFVAQQDREWERQKELWKQNELAHERFLAADAALGKRIADLTSGIGAFIARLEKKG
jgi:hypothetical protein